MMPRAPLTVEEQQRRAAALTANSPAIQSDKSVADDDDQIIALDGDELLPEGRTPEQQRNYQTLNGATSRAAPDRLRPLDLKEFLGLSIKPREMLLDPILPEKGLAMLYAARGTGKTHVALGIGYAVATGTKFLKWSAPKPRRVLLVDGEMPAAALQERLASIIASAPETQLDPQNIQILAGDLIEAGGIGNLASPDVQAEIDRWLEGVDLLELDNLSSLTAVIRDNDAESWGPIQEAAQITPARNLCVDRPSCRERRTATRNEPT
jgi:AAA domain